MFVRPGTDPSRPPNRINIACQQMLRGGRKGERGKTESNGFVPALDRRRYACCLLMRRGRVNTPPPPLSVSLFLFVETVAPPNLTLMKVSARPCTPIPMGRCLMLLFCASSTGYQFTSMILFRFLTNTVVT